MTTNAFQNSEIEVEIESGLFVRVLTGTDAKVVADPFYESVGSRHRARDEDTFFILIKAGTVIGTVRHCFENEVSFLRSMQVHPDFRGKKLGASLLKAFEKFLMERKIATTYCLPFSQLLNFYGQIGFQSIPEKAAPLFLQSRLAEYRSQFPDKSFALMKREMLL